MNSTNPDIQSDCEGLLDALDQTTSAISAFATMVEVSFRCGEFPKDESYGVYKLLQHQCEQLTSIRKELYQEIAQLRLEKLAIKNSERIAEWAGVSQYDVNRVISIATGIVLGPPTERHSAQPPYFMKDNPNGANHA